MKIITKRKIYNLTDEKPKMQKIGYESLVHGDYHFLDYSFEGESSAEGDEILSSAEGVNLTPIGDNMYMSADGGIYEYFEDYSGADDDYSGADDYYSGADDYYGGNGKKWFGKNKKTETGTGTGTGTGTETGTGTGTGTEKKGKGFFKKVGQKFGGAGKWIGKQAKAFKKFVGGLKPKKGARKLREKINTRRDNKAKAKEEARLKREKEIADAKAKGQTPPPPLPPEKEGFSVASSKNTKDEVTYVDVIPPVIADPSGKMMKQNPDGTTTEVPKSDVTTAPNGQQIDKKDIQGAGELATGTNPVTGQPEVTKTVPQEEVKELTTQEGEVIQFKASDLEKNDEGMSKGMKMALIIGGSVLVLGIIGFIIYKSRSGKGK